jgi:hypothetical protein
MRKTMLSSKGFLPYLAVLSMLGFLATDMYLPAFGAMQRDFASAPGTISASLSLVSGRLCLCAGAVGCAVGPLRP